MKSLEQDALKAQMVIAKSRDTKKRGTLDQLTESPSPAPTPSPTPMEGGTLQTPQTPLELQLFSRAECLQGLKIVKLKLYSVTSVAP